MKLLLEHLLFEQDNLVNELNKRSLKGLAAAGLMGGAALLGAGQSKTLADPGNHAKTISKSGFTEPLNKDAYGSRSAKGLIDMKKIVEIESGGDPKAVNKRSGARGLCQLMKGTWEECTQRLKKDWSWDEAFDGDKNLVVGTYYINTRIPQMLKYYKIPDVVETRLVAYNYGIGNLRKLIAKYGYWDFLNHLPEETRNYIKKYNR